MRIRIEIDEQQLRDLVFDHIANALGDIPLEREAIKVEVKSKQNYKSEWEPAAFRAVYEKS